MEGGRTRRKAGARSLGRQPVVLDRFEMCWFVMPMIFVELAPAVNTASRKIACRIIMVAK
jgi:hypothetical protein